MEPVSLLLEDENWKLLEGLPPYQAGEADQLGSRWRKEGLEPDLVSALLTQRRLRAAATPKFGARADAMLFTDAGLQQATRQVVAAEHARRFAAAGCTSVADLTSGLGADALALAERGMRVLVNDADPTTAAAAAFNLRDFPQVTVQVGDALAVDVADFDGVFVDPARRNDRGRAFDPEGYSPPLSQVLGLADRTANLGVKVAPGIPHAAIPGRTWAEWVSVDGHVVEAGLWTGAVSGGEQGRSALVLREGTKHRMEWRGNPQEQPEQMEAGPLGDYLYQPDGAVIRAGLVSTLARQLGAAPVSDRIAYLSGRELAMTPFADVFKVLEVMKYKQVGAYLRARGVGGVEILKRGTDLDPERFRKSLKLGGGTTAVQATVILTRISGRHQALVVERVRD